MHNPLKAGEEAKRERAWDPAERWKVLQDTITWAEAQATCRRNTMEYQLEAQRRFLMRRSTAGPC